MKKEYEIPTIEIIAAFSEDLLSISSEIFEVIED